jgi:CubicO group peptidase (beta-lactamase class C family)
VVALLRASDGDGWVLVAGDARSGAALVHAGASAPPPHVPVPIASASKWVSAAVILRQVQEGRLSLEDHPQRFLGPAWGAGATDARRKITLAHLLSMTSGQPFGTTPDCAWLNVSDDGMTAPDALAPLTRCVLSIASSSPALYGSAPPGTVLNYEAFNMEVAGAMTERAADDAPFAQLFAALVQPRLAAAARYTYVSPFATPLAGNLLMSPSDYATFLRAALTPDTRGGLLSADMLSTMFSPAHTARADVNGTLAMFTGARGWRYGLGVWLEEDDGSIASSLGWNGFYPRANVSSGVFAVLLPGAAAERDLRATASGALMRRSVDMMRALWAPLQAALAEAAPPAGAPSPAPADAEASTDADDCAAAAALDVNAAADDAAAATVAAQRRVLARAAGEQCVAALAGDVVRVLATVHARYDAFVCSKPAVTLCRRNATTAFVAVHTHVFVDSLFADVPPGAARTFNGSASAALAAGAAASPRLLMKLKRAVAVAAVAAAGSADADARFDAFAPAQCESSAADVNRGATNELLGGAAAAIAFAPDARRACGPAWLAEPVELRLRNASSAADNVTRVRSASCTTPLRGVPPHVAGVLYVKALSAAALRNLAAAV